MHRRRLSKRARFPAEDNNPPLMMIHPVATNAHALQDAQATVDQTGRRMIHGWIEGLRARSGCQPGLRPACLSMRHI